MTLTVGELLSLSQRNSITKPFLLKATRGANTENNNKYNTTNQTENNNKYNTTNQTENNNKYNTTNQTENNNKYNTTNQTATVSVIKSQVYGKHLHIFVFKMKNIEFYIMVLQNT